MLNTAMIEFARRVLDLLQEEKVIAHVMPSMRELLGHLNVWSSEGKPDEYMRFWTAVESDTRGFTDRLTPGTLSYTVGQVVRELCQGILASDAIDHAIWVGNIVDNILSVVGDVCLQELSEITGLKVLEETDAVMSLVALAQKKTAIKLLKECTQLLMLLSVAE